MFNRQKRDQERIDRLETQLVVNHDRYTQRQDQFRNQVTGLRAGNSKACADRWDFVERIDRGTLDNLYEHSALAARIIDRPGDDATRNGFDVDGLDRRDQDALDDFLAELDLEQNHSDAIRWSRLYGGGAMYMRVNDGQTPDKPIDFNRIESMRGLHVLDRWDLTVEKWNTDPMSVNFGEPDVYRMSIEGDNRLIHASRILPNFGTRLPMRQRRRQSGWGGSKVNQFWRPFKRYTTVHQYLMESIIEMIQGVLKVKGYAKAMQSGNRQTVTDRIRAIFRNKSTIGDMVMDPEDDYVIQHRTITGYKEALEGFTDDLVAHTDQPKSILMGINPGGLNSGANEGDWKTWTSATASFQSTKLTGNMKRMIRVIMMAKISPIERVPARWNIKWRELWETDAAAASTIHLQSAQAREIDIRTGVISADEARRQGDVKQSYQLTEAEVEESGEGTGDRGADTSGDQSQQSVEDQIQKVAMDVAEGRSSREDAVKEMSSVFDCLDQESIERIILRAV